MDNLRYGGNHKRKPVRILPWPNSSYSKHRSLEISMAQPPTGLVLLDSPSQHVRGRDYMPWADQQLTSGKP
jgi:hypothetical protein